MLFSNHVVYVFAVVLSFCVSLTSLSNAPLNVKSSHQSEKGLLVQGNTGPPKGDNEGLPVSGFVVYRYSPEFKSPFEKLSL